MRGLLRDNDLFRAYITVRAGRLAGGQGTAQSASWAAGA